MPNDKTKYYYIDKNYYHHGVLYLLNMIGLRWKHDGGFLKIFLGKMTKEEVKDSIKSYHKVNYKEGVRTSWEKNY